jgi:hypothetical protein
MRNENSIIPAIFLILSITATSSQAGTPPWTFTPLTATTISVSLNSTATVKYKVTNQSYRTHTLMMDDINGVTQITQGTGICGSPFVLSGGDSCILSLQINGSQIKSGNTNGPVVCENGSSIQCYRPISTDTLNVSITENSNTVLNTSINDLALSVRGLTEYGVNGTPTSGLPRIITITNTGNYTAENLSITMPVWPSGTTSTTTCGSALAASSSCTIAITPGYSATSDGTNPCSTGTAPVPGVVQVTAKNANTVSANVVILSYGCIYQGGYVYSLDDTTANTSSVGGKVTTTTDQTSSIIWSSNGSGGTSFIAIYGTSETSTASSPNPSSGQVTGQNACNGNTDGSCDSNNVYVYYQTAAANAPIDTSLYATGCCKGTINGYNDWYLPAICELGPNPTSSASGCGTSASPKLQNMQSNLVDNGNIGGLTGGPSGGGYWSSTSYSSAPANEAWVQTFRTTGGVQDFGGMGLPLGVRCTRVF